MGFQSLNKQFCQVFGVTHFSVLCHSLRHRDTEALKYSLFSSDFFNFRHPQLGSIYFNDRPMDADNGSVDVAALGSVAGTPVVAGKKMSRNRRAV